MILATVLLTLLLTLPAMSVELFRYRGAADDGGTIDYIFETDEPGLPKTVSEEKAAEIAADWMTTFYQVQTGVLESQEFRTRPIPHWLFCFTETVQGPIQRIFFVVVLPNGTVVKPRVAERL
jgi:hypothetical protein